MNKEEKLEVLEEIKEDSKVLEFVAITMQEREQLQSNWNSLREDLKKYDLTYLHETGEHQLADAIEDILDKMNELEGKDKNE